MSHLPRGQTGDLESADLQGVFYSGFRPHRPFTSAALNVPTPPVALPCHSSRRLAQAGTPKASLPRRPPRHPAWLGYASPEPLAPRRPDLSLQREDEEAHVMAGLQFRGTHAPTPRARSHEGAGSSNVERGHRWMAELLALFVSHPFKYFCNKKRHFKGFLASCRETSPFGARAVRQAGAEDGGRHLPVRSTPACAPGRPCPQPPWLMLTGLAMASLSARRQEAPPPK